VKTQREDHVSKANFDYRHRARTEYFADLAVVSDDYVGAEELHTVDTTAMLALVGARWRTPTPRRAGSRAYPAVGEYSPAAVAIYLTAAVHQADPQKAPSTTNIALSQSISRRNLRRCPSLSGSGRDSRRSATS
jgi:hypothetical protein